MKDKVEVRTLRTIQEIEQIRSVWQSWPGNPDSDLDMFLCYLNDSPEVERVHVVMIVRNDEPETILVGRLEKVRLDFKVGYIHVRPSAKLLYFVYGGPRGNASRENCVLLIEEVCRSLSRGEADAAYLNFIRMDSALHHAARTTPGRLCRDYTSVVQPHFTTALVGGIEGFRKTLSSKSRNTIKRRARQLVRSFGDEINLRCFREAADVDELVEDVEDVAKKSYQRGLSVGFVDTPGMRSHLRLKAEKGRLRAYVLYIRNRPCAFWIGNINGSVFCSDFLAYDAEFAAHSVGTYLMMQVVEGLCSDPAEAVKEIDFATGNAQYKAVLGNRMFTEASVYAFAPSVKGLQLSLLRFVTAGIENIAKRTLIQTGLLQRIKTTWRKRARAKSGDEAGLQHAESAEVV